jgi:hypothetical protein
MQVQAVGRVCDLFVVIDGDLCSDPHQHDFADVVARFD